jgi:hypothetical protein
MTYWSRPGSAREKLHFSAKSLLVPVILAAGLSGCATTRYSTIYCVGKDQTLPAEPPKVGPKLTGRADEDTRILAGSAIRLRAWGRGLADILEHCREPQH